ncbi:hypothetical protein [Paractinoplanes globisporus]|uniref:Uncharacterized protein n=1 Tax=Paractinoplanes globisporus TaxID=113565 RepID=A0ABW6WH21_9ACTN|nr:hypothetical protein [Actinoplanes globisporus]
MTSQPQPVPGEVKSAGQYLRPLRDLAAYALVGAAGIFIFLAIVDLIPDGAGQFGFRTQGSFGGFINLETIGFPIAAVLLALLVQPRHPKAQLIVVIALVEYAVMALFGVLFGVLIGLINEADHNGARSALEGLLSRVAWLAVFAVAAYAVFQIWRNLFYTPRPKPQAPPPGVYGQPQYGQPSAYPGQPGYGPPPGQPTPGQPGFPPPPGGYPPPPPPAGQQGFSPGVYGQPAAPTWNQPAVPIPNPAQPTQPVPPGPYAPHPGSPTSAVPASGAPAPAAPPPSSPAGTTYPAAGTTYPPVEPTQPVPSAGAETDDRTQMLGDERPGFGPADQDPPRQ